MHRLSKFDQIKFKVNSKLGLLSNKWLLLWKWALGSSNKNMPGSKGTEKMTCYEMKMAEDGSKASFQQKEAYLVSIPKIERFTLLRPHVASTIELTDVDETNFYFREAVRQMFPVWLRSHSFTIWVHQLHSDVNRTLDISTHSRCRWGYLSKLKIYH